MSEDLFKCPLCEKLIPKLSKLEHAKKHVKTQPKNNCKHCGKNFLLKWVLEEHERLHTGEKPIQCASCEKSFRAKQGLYIHVKTHHTKTLTTKCDPCWKTFHSKRDLSKHLSKYHGEDEGFKCDKAALKKAFFSCAPPLGFWSIFRKNKNNNKNSLKIKISIVML